MEPSQNHKNQTSFNKKKPFARFLEQKELEIKGEGGFWFNAVSYNEKYDMILACPDDKSLQFCNTTTLLPHEEFKTEQLDSQVRSMAFCSETDTYLLRCRNGDIYTYDLGKKVLKYIQNGAKIGGDQTVEWINSVYYAFLVNESELYIGNILDGSQQSFFQSENRGWHAPSLHNATKNKVLLSGFRDSIRIFRADCLPKFPLSCSIFGKDIGWKIETITVSKKEYVIAFGFDNRIRIWHFIKGKMKLLKVIHMRCEYPSMVYLEKYKILAVAHTWQRNASAHPSALTFVSFLSGKVESSFSLNLNRCSNIFFMKNKNSLGAAKEGQNVVKVIEFNH